MRMLGDQLRVVDRELARLTAKRLSILDQIAKLDAEDGASERQTASRVARLSASSPKQAAAEIATAKQVSALPKLAEAHANGEISNGQLGAVAAIASASSEREALDFAKTATSSQLQQRASASRGKLFEERRKAHSDRYLGFKPEDGGQSVRIHGRLPFAESQQLESQLRKIADRLNQCDKDRPSPSARMADALLILTNSNASQAVHDHLNSNQKNAEQARTESSARERRMAAGVSQTAQQANTKAESSAHASTAGDARESPKSGSNTLDKAKGSNNGPENGTNNGSAPVNGRSDDEESFWAGRSGDGASARKSSPTESTSTRITSTASAQPAALPEPHNVSAPTGRPTNSFIDYDEEPFPETSAQNHEPSNFDEDDEVAFQLDEERPANSNGFRSVVVQRADTRLIIHWNAQTGSLNIENGPPIDHPRLQAILCDAQIDVQHCDINGLPTGLITTAHHSDWRQDRYLAHRDGPCRIPECLGIGKTQAHHIFENRIDRTTSVQRMINLCNRDHQNHHDGLFTITGDPEHILTFTYQDGTVLASHARPLPVALKPPKATPFAKHKTPNDTQDLFTADKAA